MWLESEFRLIQIFNKCNQFYLYQYHFDDTSITKPWRGFKENHEQWLQDGLQSKQFTYDPTIQG